MVVSDAPLSLSTRAGSPTQKPRKPPRPSVTEKAIWIQTSRDRVMP